MEAQAKTDWLAALRSGEYQQGEGLLFEQGSQRYCCLGVLCDLFVKAHPEEYHWGFVVGTRGICGSVDDNTGDGGNVITLPQVVIAWAGLNECNPSIVSPEGYKTHLAQYNDDGKSFLQIADIIESQF